MGTQEASSLCDLGEISLCNWGGISLCNPGGIRVPI
jgi:hypothetical protein